MTINSFMYMGEEDHLLLRLEMLKDVVDRFVLVEADVTFSGMCKPTVTRSGLSDKFSKFNIDIIHVKDMPYSDNPWEREQHQFVSMMKAVEKMNPDILLATDIDEHVKPEVIDKIKSSQACQFIFEMDMLKFSAATKELRFNWSKVMACKPKEFDIYTFDRGRRDSSAEIITDAGWHLEYMGGRQAVLNKINSTSHFREIGSRTFWLDMAYGTHDFSYIGLYEKSKLPDANLKAFEASTAFDIGGYSDRVFELLTS